MRVKLISGPYGSSRLGDHLLRELADPKWTRLLASVAFVKRSGTSLLQRPLRDFSSRSAVRITVGVDHGGTSVEGIEDLLGVLSATGALWVLHHPPSPGHSAHHTLHPKLFMFDSANEAVAIVGSGNLTRGGLFGNYEAGVAISLDLADSESKALHSGFVNLLDTMANPASPACKLLDKTLLTSLHASGLVKFERTIRPSSRGSSSGGGSTARIAGIFASPPTSLPPVPLPMSVSVPTIVTRPTAAAGPSTGPSGTAVPAPSTAPPAGGPSPAAPHTAFYIEVVPQHNGEIFLSARAVAVDPAFFGHPFTGLTIPRRPGNPPYPQRTPDPIVEIVVYDTTDTVIWTANPHNLNLVEYTRNREFRITVPPMARSNIPPMSLLVMEPAHATGLDYRLSFYPPGSPTYGTLSSNLTTTMPGGGNARARRYGWS